MTKSRSRPAGRSAGPRRAKAGEQRWRSIWPLAAFGVLMAVVAGMVILATTRNPAPAITSQEQIPRINVLDAQGLLERGAAVLYDTRSAEAYAVEHASGALSLPDAELSAHLSDLPKDKTLIFYCT